MKNLRVKAASYFLCNDNVKEALHLLDESEGDTIPDEVSVMAYYEFEPKEMIIKRIDELHEAFDEVYYEGFDEGFIDGR